MIWPFKWPESGSAFILISESRFGSDVMLLLIGFLFEILVHQLFECFLVHGCIQMYGNLPSFPLCIMTKRISNW